MSEHKYIIRNCPCYWHIGEDDGCSLENMKLCEDDTDCVMKQIVQVCNEYSDKWEDCDFSNGLADEILKLLDMQEVE